MDAESDHLVQTIFAFIQAETWVESKRIVEAHRELLLSDTADEMFEDLLNAAAGDVPALRIFESHRLLLARCRVEGIDDAFAELLVQSEAELPSGAAELEALVQLVRDFVEAETWAESESIVLANQGTLLTGAGEIVLASLIEGCVPKVL